MTHVQPRSLAKGWWMSFVRMQIASRVSTNKLRSCNGPIKDWNLSHIQAACPFWQHFLLTTVCSRSVSTYCWQHSAKSSGQNVVGQRVKLCCTNHFAKPRTSTSRTRQSDCWKPLERQVAWRIHELYCTSVKLVKPIRRPETPVLFEPGTAWSGGIGLH